MAGTGEAMADGSVKTAAFDLLVVLVVVYRGVCISLCEKCVSRFVVGGLVENREGLTKKKKRGY